jgi:hypothetical protein
MKRDDRYDYDDRRNEQPLVDIDEDGDHIQGALHQTKGAARRGPAVLIVWKNWVTTGDPTRRHLRSPTRPAVAVPQFLGLRRQFAGVPASPEVPSKSLRHDCTPTEVTFRRSYRPAGRSMANSTASEKIGTTCGDGKPRDPCVLRPSKP